jgi:hypothetical protein
MPSALRQGRRPNYVISRTTTSPTSSKSALLLKEVGLLRPLEAQLDVNIVPLFETIDDLRACGEVMDALLAIPPTPAPRQPRRRAGGHARLFRQQQGRRLSDLGWELTRPRWR